MLASNAVAATYLVAPDGGGSVCTRAEPCALGTAAELAQAGDTVILMDGTYHEPLHPENSGTPDAWITFKADACALPIIEGPGEGIVEYETAGDAPSGVASSTGEYLRFIGIVSRYWDSGFTNGWTGAGTTNSNGHFEYINCIGDGNGRTGMVLYSAPNITIRESISAHNGGNPQGSWSSGIQLYAVQGTADDNIIERNVSFENTDAQNHSDGSGFIVDEDTLGATFINNLAFRNGGSCMRLTRSDNTRMINFTCFHNGQNPDAYSPTNPGEFYFTDSQSRSTAIVINSLAAASGTEMDPAAFMFPPESGVSNNFTIDSGPTPFYTDPEGVNPDFRPPASAAAQVENQGSLNNAPFVDIGFDPKCIVRRDPAVPFQKSWWTHAIDYDYIRSIGGVAKCFHPKQRSGGVDIGAYELSGEPHAFSSPGSCVPTYEDEAAEPVEAPEPDDGGEIDPGDEATGGTDMLDDPEPDAPVDPQAPAPTPTGPPGMDAEPESDVINGIMNATPNQPAEMPAVSPTSPTDSTVQASGPTSSAAGSVTPAAGGGMPPGGGVPGAFEPGVNQEGSVGNSPRGGGAGCSTTVGRAPPPGGLRAAPGGATIGMLALLGLVVLLRRRGACT